MRLGLLGLGRIGEFHARTLAALSAFITLVVADLDVEALERVRRELPALRHRRVRV